jgi:hypothetical protein
MTRCPAQRQSLSAARAAAAPPTQQCPPELLNGTWGHFYNETSKHMFALLGHASMHTLFSYGWADARDKCRSLGPHFELAWYDSYDQQLAVETSFMFTSSIHPTQDYCYWLGYVGLPVVEHLKLPAVPAVRRLEYSCWRMSGLAWA